VKLLRKLKDASVDLVLCDLPYGITNCGWDKKIDTAALWAQYVRVLRPHGAVVLFAQGAFSGELMAAAPAKWFRYEWMWDKVMASGWLNAKKMPMRQHETILVFGRQIHYFPQGVRKAKGRFRKGVGSSAIYRGAPRAGTTSNTRTGYPKSLLHFCRELHAGPAVKPVALLRYLIETYTRRGDTVLDNAMGTGSAGVAVVELGRVFVGMEIDRARFKVALVRIGAAVEDGQDTGGETAGATGEICR
jgi:site-specific DNA-methyltransferase (adenine-specific)